MKAEAMMRMGAGKDATALVNELRQARTGIPPDFLPSVTEDVFTGRKKVSGILL